MPPIDEIEPVVPELPRPVRPDGGERADGPRTTPGRRSDVVRERAFDDSESDAPLVPDLS